MRCRERASRFRARVDTGNTLPRPALRIRGSTPPGRTGPWRRWQRQAFRRRTRASDLERVKGIELTPQILRVAKSTINAADLGGERSAVTSRREDERLDLLPGQRWRAALRLGRDLPSQSEAFSCGC